MSEEYHRKKPHEEDEESLPETLTDSLPGEKQEWKRMPLYDEKPSFISRLRHNMQWVAHGLLLSTSLIFFAASYRMQNAKPSEVSYTEAFSSWSPAAGVVQYHTERYNLTPIMDWSPYVGYGAEVDRAWDHITNNIGDQMISQEELDKLGLDPASLKIKHPMTGEEGYRIGIEVFHQLHCLNLLRMATYREWYSLESVGGDVATDDEDLRGHVDHCLEALRLNLMCQSDIGVFTFKNYPDLDVEGHWPDFSTLHVCRNFDAIRDWAMVNSVTFEDEE
ncbi:hypothetical protein B0T11DRAFT_74102 [Plectosphaerella cucumerina]|uniref:Cyclochlorotine biosynthesis protein O n=1 Tax=Plectosphaerella cucumerina TaxID=40658 RepID=A0A8K0TJH1_9PEZI|nr:hypothetical protein B0T11DRAFT_74102 [Plectosphaerella cucumerina]